MSEYDLVIRNGTVATAADTTSCDVGIKNGVVVTLGNHLGSGAREIDASGRLVLPGGIDSHCHIEQRSSAGVVCADDFYSATVAAAFGGTTTVIPFAAQHRGQSLRQVVEEYHTAAGPKAIIDYAFHLIISDPSEQVMGQELPALIRDGYTSFKVYMTYDLLQLDDGQMLDILAVARCRVVPVPPRAPRDNKLAGRRSFGPRPRGAALPRGQPRPPRRGGGNQPG